MLPPLVPEAPEELPPVEPDELPVEPEVLPPVEPDELLPMEPEVLPPVEPDELLPMEPEVLPEAPELDLLKCASHSLRDTWPSLFVSTDEKLGVEALLLPAEAEGDEVLDDDEGDEVLDDAEGVEVLDDVEGFEEDGLDEDEDDCATAKVDRAKRTAALVMLRVLGMYEISSGRGTKLRPPLCNPCAATGEAAMPLSCRGPRGVILSGSTREKATATACPWCSAPRADGPSCPRCGANYAKAAQIKSGGKAVIAPAAPAEETLPAVAIQAAIVGSEDQVVDDPKLEFRITAAALPCALALGLLFHAITPGAQRIFFGMPVHELGHAVSAWFCGYFAIPTLWKTLVFSDERGLVWPVLLACALLFGIYRSWKAEKPAYIALLVALLVLQATGTLYIREGTAEMVFTWGGDGMGMVLAAMLMATFFVGKRTDLYKGWVRWGLLVIGAAAFSDMFGTWWAARSSRDAIPFGEIEGVGLSDPMKLLAEHGWEITDIVRRYVRTGFASLAALLLVYVWGVRRAWHKAKEAK